MKFTPELTVFICGAIVMVMELVGSRVLGPYFGTSLYVWTSLIGIFLGGLSIGYALGGRLADRQPDYHKLARVVYSGGVALALVFILKDPFLQALGGSSLSVSAGAIIAANILFLVPSILLGMVTPYAAKLKLNDLKVAGQELGNLYALSTIGSIAGTFLAGYYLIPSLGTNQLLILLSVTLILLSMLLSRKLIFWAVLAIIGLSISWSLFLGYSQKLNSAGFIDLDTSYNRIWIMDGEQRDSGRRIRTLGINAENHSSMFLDGDELVNEYTKYFHLARHFRPDFHRTLMLGGAGYSFPKSFLQTYSDATMDVIEIDPIVTELAYKYFRLPIDPRLTVIHQDGRIFQNKTADTYDVIWHDAFSSRYAPPFHLTTIESVRRQHEMLTPDGVIILNLISAIEGNEGMFLRAEYHTYRTVFPQVYVFRVNSPDPLEVQNLIMVALKSPQTPSLTSDDPELSSFLNQIWTKNITTDLPILTDDYAPVEHYINQIL